MNRQRPLKILHVVGSARSESGGPIEGIRQQGRYLVKIGHQIEVCSMDDPNQISSEEVGLPTHALGPKQFGFFCPKLSKWLDQHMDDFDAVIINGLWEHNGIAVHRQFKKRPVPYYVFTHGMLDPWFNKEYPLKKFKKKLFWPFQYPVLRDAVAVLFTSEEERLLARESFQPYNVNERVVPYGTSTPPSFTKDHANAFYKKLPSLRGKKFLMCIGRIHPKKGIDLLIKAYSEVYGNDADMSLVIAGPDQIGIQRQLKILADKLGVGDRILWPGMLTGDAKWGAFHLMEAFVLPSHQENFGIVVAESLACGKPVFISNKINIWREVENSGAGSVEQDTVEGAVRLLNSYKQLSASEYSELSVRAKACFDKNFEVSAMALGLIDNISPVVR